MTIVSLSSQLAACLVSSLRGLSNIREQRAGMASSLNRPLFDTSPLWWDHLLIFATFIIKLSSLGVTSLGKTSYFFSETLGHMESLKVSFDGDASDAGIMEIFLKDVGYDFAGVRSEPVKKKIVRRIWRADEDCEEDLKRLQAARVSGGTSPFDPLWLAPPNSKDWSS